MFGTKNYKIKTILKNFPRKSFYWNALAWNYNAIKNKFLFLTPIIAMNISAGGLLQMNDLFIDYFKFSEIINFKYLHN